MTLQNDLLNTLIFVLQTYSGNKNAREVNKKLRIYYVTYRKNTYTTFVCVCIYMYADDKIMCAHNTATFSGQTENTPSSAQASYSAEKYGYERNLA